MPNLNYYLCRWSTIGLGSCMDLTPFGFGWFEILKAFYSYISVPPNTGNSGSRSSHIYWIYVRSLTLHIYWIQEVGLCIVIEYMESDSSYSLNTGSRSPHIQLNTGSRYPQICWIQEVSLCLVIEYMESDYAYSIEYRESDSA